LLSKGKTSAAGLCDKCSQRKPWCRGAVRYLIKSNPHPIYPHLSLSLSLSLSLFLSCPHSSFVATLLKLQALEELIQLKHQLYSLQQFQIRDRNKRSRNYMKRREPPSPQSPQGTQQAATKPIRQVRRRHVIGSIVQGESMILFLTKTLLCVCVCIFPAHDLTKQASACTRQRDWTGCLFRLRRRGAGGHEGLPLRRRGRRYPRQRESCDPHLASGKA
jgi:hypothetical protein